MIRREEKTKRFSISYVESVLEKAMEKQSVVPGIDLSNTSPIATPLGLIERVLKREDTRIFISTIRLRLEARQGYNITPPWYCMRTVFFVFFENSTHIVDKNNGINGR